MAESPRWAGPQRRIGLTGGIATGKSSVGRWLAAARGLPLLDADLYAREALARGSDGEAAVLAQFGAAVQAPEGGIDRAALGQRVFADPSERQWLEQLVHPLVRQRFAAELQRLVAAPVVVMMIPLLFEAGLESLCSEIWLVDCPPEQQLERLIARDRCSPEQARARIAAQWPLARKRPLADLVLDNSGPPQAWQQAAGRALG
jgi:dephospho-CoA kinase